MKTADFPQLRELSLSEKLLLVEELWDEVARESAALPIPEWHRSELDQSMAEHRQNPREGSSWPETKARILDRG